jgi:RNA polymerase sigma-70 factor (ECF subfamily)
VDVGDAWSRFKDRLHAFALRRVGSAAEADDVVQDVLVRLLQHRDGIETDRLAAWLFTTARNAVIDRRRKSDRDPAAAESAVVADVAAAASNEAGRELSACVQPLLAMLSADDRTVLEQVELAGQSQAELAGALNVPASTLKSRVQRARRRLRERFERCCEIELDGRGAPHQLTSRGSPEYPRCDGSASERVSSGYPKTGERGRLARLAGDRWRSWDSF